MKTISIVTRTLELTLQIVQRPGGLQISLVFANVSLQSRTRRKIATASIHESITHNRKETCDLPPNLMFIARIREKIVELHWPRQIGGKLRSSVLIRGRVARVHAAISIDSRNQAIKITIPIANIRT